MHFKSKLEQPRQACRWLSMADVCLDTTHGQWCGTPSQDCIDERARLDGVTKGSACTVGLHERQRIRISHRVVQSCSQQSLLRLPARRSEAG